MTSDDITITHHLTGKGTGQLTAGQQQQLAALVPAEATTTTRTEDGGTFTAAKWSWTATWTAEQDQAWRAAQQPDNPLPADWAAHLTDFDAVDTQHYMADGKTVRCQAVSDGTHGYIAGSQCTRVSGHDTPRNIVGHYYLRQPQPKS